MPQGADMLEHARAELISDNCRAFKQKQPFDSELLILFVWTSTHIFKEGVEQGGVDFLRYPRDWYYGPVTTLNAFVVLCVRLECHTRLLQEIVLQKMKLVKLTEMRLKRKCMEVRGLPSHLYRIRLSTLSLTLVK